MHSIRLQTDNATRDTVLALVELNPGATKTQLVACSGLAWGTIWYHLDKLVKAEAVVIHRLGRTSHVFSKGTVEAQRLALCALKRASAQTVYDSCVQHPEVSAPFLARKLALNPKTVRKRLEELEKLALLLRVGKGRARYRINHVSGFYNARRDPPAVLP
jgi:predicted transcriptional regulator